MINATELFEKLVESGIWFSLCPTQGMDGKWRFYPCIRGRDEYLDTLGETLHWLGTAAAELYPDSEFAKWWKTQ